MTENQELFFFWVKERESIRQKKEKGLPKPWTDNQILQRYKFCNVRREDDRVTVWIKDNWREQYRGHPNMWFAMIVARLFNWPPTLENIGFPDWSSFGYKSFKEYKEHCRFFLKDRRDTHGLKIFTGAYLVSTNGVKMDKVDYILDRVLTPIWERGCDPQHLGESAGGWKLEDYWYFLTQFDGLGSFMAGQVIADLKYVDPVLEQASDWWTFAPLGPGSIRGLNRFFGRPTDKPLKQEPGLKEILEIRTMIYNRLGYNLPAHDVQNCMCETDKFIRLTKGEGKTRSTYPGV